MLQQLLMFLIKMGDTSGDELEQPGVFKWVH